MQSKQNEIDPNSKQMSKTKIKTLSIVFAVFILGIIGMVIMTFFLDNATSIELEENTYQYYGDGIIEHPIGTRIKNSEIANILLEGDKTLGLDSTPLYSYDNMTIYTPINYAYCSVKDNAFWRIPEFTTINKEEATNMLHCSFGDNEYSLECGFLFSGGGNFVFFDDGRIIINDFDEYPVSSFSFFSKDYDILRVYNYADKEYNSLTNISVNVIYLSNSGYSVDLIKGIYVDSTGNRIMLVASPEVLNNIEESVSDGEKQ